MAIKQYKANTSGRRDMSTLDNSDLSRVRPLKSLVSIRKKFSGRNNSGHITVRHQGGGVKRLLREVDFKGYKLDVVGKVVTIEYDPNRNCRIALIAYSDGVKRYILAPENLRPGQTVVTSKQTLKATPGSRFPVELIPQGTNIYNLELEPGKGGKIVRSAGTAAILQVVEGSLAQVKLPSGEIRLIPKECFASVGQVSNTDFRNIRWGKAGRMRYKNIRPTVRGKVMNPVDHPHGGGEGKNSIGLKGGPKNVYGKKALGVKTRDPKKKTNKLIISRRPGRIK